MVYMICGFVWGCLIPYAARRFAKFMPATMAYAIYRLIYPTKVVSRQKRKDSLCYRRLMRRYAMRSLGWGIITCALSYLAMHKFGGVYLWWYLAFIWILLLLTEIDYRMQLLPDILTVPLLIGGFAYASFVGIWILPIESALGASFGYIVPVVASILFVKKNPDALGGGDIKLLAALGAWMGFEKLMYAIILACLIFLITVVLYRKKRDGAFGPALAMGAIAVVFYFF